MKVGILSMQRVANYGSFMQAWALRQMLSELGADVSFIDIVPGRQLPGHNAKGFRKHWVRARELAKALLTGELGMKMRGRKFYRAMRARYHDEYYTMLGLNALPPARYDLAVIGSDQVFNCFERNPWGFTTQLYGDIPQAGHIISYAGSFGNATLGDLQRAGVADEIAANLMKLDAISVRDDNSYELVRRLTGREAVKHLDPVLVYDFSRELEGRTSGRSDYIVVYAYAERIRDRAEVEAIRAFARAKGKRLVSIFSAYDWCDESVIPPTPFDVLAWIRDADYVVTDTFHGTIFSAITHRPFCTLVRASNSEKLGSLLRWLALDNRRAATSADIAAVLETPTDYAQTNRIIADEKVRTREYLAAELARACMSSRASAPRDEGSIASL
ncbi:MAG: polysaccharide pyruvyl transferase family protein [Rikenellaceae bacterium]|nr:polysaccharide pyruvyl transferase family protein [Rikenellaceae bacterium]MCL2692769.1 polysaccharide pyruvyl transferase family protein [Rikenellaceae bacterium]